MERPRKFIKVANVYIALPEINFIEAEGYFYTTFVINSRGRESHYLLTASDASYISK